MRDRKKDCFGILERVFPMGEKGLREVPPDCFQCPDRTDCMRAAMETEEGLQMREQTVDRAAKSGMLSRLQRWSRKKDLHRKAREKKRGK